MKHSSNLSIKNVSGKVRKTRKDASDGLIKIIHCLKSGPRTSQELQEETGFSRTKIYRVCKILGRPGLVKKYGNKFGKYQLTIDNYLERKGVEFCSKFSQRFVATSPLKMEESFCNDYFRDKDYLISKIKQYLSTESRSDSHMENSLENGIQSIDDLLYQLQINEFSRMVAAYVTYVLIQAVSPYLWKPKINDIPINMRLPGKQRDKASEAWVNSSLDPEMFDRLMLITIYKWQWIKNAIFSKRLLFEFSNLQMVTNGQHHGTVVKGPKLSDFILSARKEDRKLSEQERSKFKKIVWDHEQLYEKMKKKTRDTTNPYWSRYEIVDEDVYQKLMNNFKKLFPEDYEKFEEIWKDLYV